MHNKEVQHTLVIFEIMQRRMPPMVPNEIVEEFKHVIEHLKSDYNITLTELEDTVVVFGKKIWPYWKAFEEVVNMEEGNIGEKFFMGRLSPHMKKRYKEFKEHGGDFRDLYSGDPMHFFEVDERVDFSHAFVEMDRDIREHARQMVLSTEQKHYQDSVIEFQNIYDDIEKRLDSLRLLADDEQEHPQLAEEIREKIKSFEHGLCLLGPSTRYEEVCGIEDHFDSRRKTKHALR
jgi:hypothetical protein